MGVNNGKAARSNNVILNTKNGKLNVPKKTGLKLNKGESIIFKTGGGGGYGDPIERSNKKILNDLKQEYISKEYVEKHYPQFKS